MSTIAFVGISGVGKSTFLSKMIDLTQFHHLQASQLIKEEKARIDGQIESSENLRKGQVLDNQRLLINAFIRKRSALDGVTILDGHTLIDTPSGLIEIPAYVFEEIGINHFIFLRDHPDKICKKRISDISRQRPSQSALSLAEHQSRALELAIEAATQINCPLSIFTPSLVRECAILIQSVP
jgi:adenylate kinase